ncbi:MAG: hypothetical protein IJK67_00290 [Bacilli bacterium]|nr:hypothetical protein [Bacilli bacterium]
MKKKNYYELQAEDIDQYKNLYSEVRYARFLNECKLVCLITFIFGFVIGNILTLFLENGFDVETVTSLMNGIALISFIVYFPLIIYDHYCFKRWLKLKHNIEY